MTEKNSRKKAFTDLVISPLLLDFSFSEKEEEEHEPFLVSSTN